MSQLRARGLLLCDGALQVGDMAGRVDVGWAYPAAGQVAATTLGTTCIGGDIHQGGMTVWLLEPLTVQR